MSKKPARAGTRTSRPTPRPAPVGRTRGRMLVWAVVAVAAAIGGLYALTSLGGSGKRGGGGYPYAVGSPGVGQAAPAVVLPSTSGGTFDLSAYRGRAQVLLYFQEGLTCQPCWDQLAAIEKDAARFRALGIGRIVSVTTDPIDLIGQKVRDEGITMPVLSDASFRVSDSYDARGYGMMQGTRDGHTFVLVGKDGRIRWRADYGGAPNYFMFVPDDVLVAHLRRALHGSAA